MGASPQIFNLFCPSGATAAQADYVVWVPDPTQPLTHIAIWLAIDGDNTAPSGAGYATSDGNAKVVILSTDTAIQVAAKLVMTTISVGPLDGSRLDGLGWVDNEDGSITVTSTINEIGVLPVTHNEDDSGPGSFTYVLVQPGYSGSGVSVYIELDL